jgi:hypothetical protein
LKGGDFRRWKILVNEIARTSRMPVPREELEIGDGF